MYVAKLQDTEERKNLRLETTNENIRKNKPKFIPYVYEALSTFLQNQQKTLLEALIATTE